jgi:peptide subunit release factor 1 (eRF1)
MPPAVANELDTIRATATCPKCGEPFSVSYRTLRLRKVVECQGCGVTIRPVDETSIGAVQRLIDGA